MTQTPSQEAREAARSYAEDQRMGFLNDGHPLIRAFARFEAHIRSTSPASDTEVMKPSVADPANLTSLHIRLLERGARSKWIGLSNDAGVNTMEIVALGQLARAGLVRPVEDELPPGPPSMRPHEITDEGRAALRAGDTDAG